MSEKTRFYRAQPVTQVLILNSQVQKFRSIFDYNQRYIFQSFCSNGESQLFELQSNYGDFLISQLDVPISGKVLFIRDSYLFVKSNANKLQYLDRITKAMIDFNFQPDYLCDLPSLNGVLFLSRSKDLSVFLHDTKSLVIPHTLVRILQPYTSVKDVSYIHVNEETVIAVALHLKQLKVYHVVIVKLMRNQEGAFTFQMVDLLKMKEGKILNKVKIIESGKEILIVQNASSIKKVKINLDPKGIQSFRRSETKFKHDLNFFKVKQIVFLQNMKDLAIQDSAGRLFIINQQQQNLFFDDNSSHTLLLFSDQMFLVSQDKIDHKQISLCGLFQQSAKKLINDLVEDEGLLLTAYRMSKDIKFFKFLVRRTGEGRQLISQLSLEKSNYTDQKQLLEFLNNNDTSASLIYEILMTKKIDSLESLEKLIAFTLDKGSLSEKQVYQLLIAAKRIDLLKSVDLQQGFMVQEFALKYCIIEAIYNITQISKDPQGSMQELFQKLEDEIILNYEEVMRNLPLEILDPKFLLSFLPLGYIKDHNRFWQRMRILIEDKDQFLVLITNQQIYIDISLEYIYHLNQPGKALRILQEASQARMIQGLNSMALQAVEFTLISNVDNMNSYDLKIGDLFGIKLSQQESLRAIENFFSYAKWIFIMDQSLYQRYLRDLRYYLVELIGVEDSPMLAHILERHGQNQLLFLVNPFIKLTLQRDQDLAQLVLDIIYDKLTTQNIQQVQFYQNKLTELTISQNQSYFIKDYLQLHTIIQDEIAQAYGLDLSFKDLLRLQTLSSTDQCIDEVGSLFHQMVDFVIEKKKQVQYQILSFGRKSTMSKRWIALLEAMIRLRGILGYSESQVDVYQIFLQKLLDGRVIQSIEALIQSDIIPIEEIQISVIKYLQTQFNQCTTQDFLQFAAGAKEFLQLLIQNDNSGTYLIKLEEETKLLDVAIFLKQNDLLLDKIPFTQLRADFYQNRVIDRVLQVEGFSEYPTQFSILLELQQIIDDSEQNQVIVKVFSHLNTLRYFESRDRFPDYLPNMLYELILLRKEESIGKSKWVHQIQHLLLKLAITLDSTSQRQLKKDILVFLQRYMDKQSSIYLDACRSLIMLSKRQWQRSDLLSQLKQSLNQGIKSKAKHLITQFSRPLLKNNVSKEKVFIQLVAQSDLTYKQMKTVALILEMDVQFREKLKVMKNVSSHEIIEALNNPEQFERLAQQKKASRKSQKSQAKSKTGQDQIESQLKQIVAMSNDFEQVKKMLLENYRNEKGLDIQKILEHSEQQQIYLSESAMMHVFEILGLNLNNVMLLDVYRMTGFNPLYVISNQEEIPYKSFRDKHLQNMFDEKKRSPLLREFISKATDTHFFSIMAALEQLTTNEDQGYSLNRFEQLFALALYANKLQNLADHYWSIKAMSRDDIERLFYGYIDKDTLGEFIEDREGLELLNSMFEEHFKRVNNENLRAEHSFIIIK